MSSTRSVMPGVGPLSKVSVTLFMWIAIPVPYSKAGGIVPRLLPPSHFAHGRAPSQSEHSCSARLQAGILLFPKCPPEGGRHKSQYTFGANPRFSYLTCHDSHTIVDAAVPSAPGN